VTVTAQFVPGPLSAAALNVSSIPVVTALSDIIAPFNGQIVFLTTDNMLYRYDSTVWVAFLATGGGTASTLHEARYEQRASGQPVTSSTDTKMKAEALVTTCNDVTASGTNNTDFLLNRGGVWRVAACARFLGNAGSGERHVYGQTGTTFVVTNRFGADTKVNVGSAPVTVGFSTEIRVAAGTSLCIGLWHNAGSSITLDTGFGGTQHIALTWLRP
jgi:hypothetical protein